MTESADQPETANHAPVTLDVDANSADLKISKDIYIRILDKAMSQTELDLQELRAAVTNNDLEKVQLLSHRMKGDYANLRIQSLSLAAKVMNDAMKESRPDSAVLLKMYEEIAGVFRQIKQLVNP